MNLPALPPPSVIPEATEADWLGLEMRLMRIKSEQPAHPFARLHDSRDRIVCWLIRRVQSLEQSLSESRAKHAQNVGEIKWLEAENEKLRGIINSGARRR